MENNPVQLLPHLTVTLLLVITVLFPVAEAAAVSSIKTDAQALLMFKRMIQKDPNNGVLSGWKLSKNPCTWDGVTCTLGRVTQLDISGNNNLAETISLDPLSSLDMLSVLKLSLNSFSVNSTSLLQLPYSLTQLDLSFGRVIGPVPENLFSKCPNLVDVNLSYNNLTGPIPENFFQNSDKLQALDISFNNLSGSIFGLKMECISLLQLDLSGNHLSDSIPLSLSNCTSLKSLNLAYNMISGGIPKALGQLNKLQTLDLSHNQLTGWIPSELGNACASLLELKLSFNNISGSIPSGFSSCTWLQLLDISNNNMSGQLPDSIFQNLGSLQELMLGNNAITGQFPSSISSCKKLKIVDFSSNKIYGSIPRDLCPGAASLEELRMPDNLITGEIPAELSKCSQLKTLDFSLNYLNGTIPDELGELENLEQLIAWFNGLEGRIPPKLGQCKNLKDLILNNNHLTGGIPIELFNCSNLEWISLTSNELSGEIPHDMFTKYQTLEYLDLSYNQLRGKIPDEFGDMVALQVLELSHNQLSGEIPSSLGQLKNLGVFDASHNRLQGHIPDSFSNLSFLVQIDLSNNELTGQIPSRGQLSTLPASQYANNPASLIGCGGFGEVFKATLKDGSSVAIKKLIRLSCQGDREFMAEMETLGKIKHRNLVPLLGYCKVGEERLLVYEYMEYGSLEEMLHGRIKTRDRRILTWEERKKIARGAAKGLCFLHHNCIPHIIHRDMKSSNVLLDHEMESRVSDFGMARLISALDTHLSVSTLAGTPGYVPPEYYQSFRCTAKGDVYSFGVVMLELLSGKRPTDKEDFGDTNLVGWSKMKVREGKQMEVIDSDLLLATQGTDEAEAKEVKEMIRYLEITLQCVDDLPSRRPNMLQVVAMLRELMPGSTDGSSNSA
uniref:non-specific serine/threonine protein kinase n=1 Tax=Cajanus cajan TaxID=3821 RepID=A0A151T2K4_CAJCA|nr:Serine/threonine-protein kinase BRI1-like 2 [Cajanus cajan]